MITARLFRTTRPLPIWAMAALSLSLYAVVALWVQTVVNPTFMSDLSVYLGAGQKALAGTNPYQPFSIGPSFVYPPTALLVFSPLSLLPFGTARLLWLVSSMACYLLAIASLLRCIRKPDMGRTTYMPLVILLLAYAPFLETLSVGQINCFVLLGISLFISESAENKGGKWAIAADVGLAVAIALKMTPALLLAYPVLQGDWRRCLRVLLCASSLFILSILAFGVKPWLDFAEIVPVLLQGFPELVNQALGPTLSHYFAQAGLDQTVGEWVGRIFIVLAIGSWLWVCVAARCKATATSGRSDRHTTLAVLTFGTAVMTISSSLIWYHHLIFLVIPLCYLLLQPSLPAWALPSGLIALGLIQMDRVIERTLHAPPLLAIGGYLLIYFCLFVYLTGLLRPARRRAGER